MELIVFIYPQLLFVVRCKKTFVLCLAYLSPPLPLQKGAFVCLLFKPPLPLQRRGIFHRSLPLQKGAFVCLLFKPPLPLQRRGIYPHSTIYHLPLTIYHLPLTIYH